MNTSNPKPEVEKPKSFFDRVVIELASARRQHPGKPSPAAAREVIREEFEEFIEASRAERPHSAMDGGKADREHSIAELVQLASTCLRAAIEIYGFPEEQ